MRQAIGRPQFVSNSEHSTLPRLHQKHEPSRLSLMARVFSLCRTMPLLSSVPSGRLIGETVPKVRLVTGDKLNIGGIPGAPAASPFHRRGLNNEEQIILLVVLVKIRRRIGWLEASFLTLLVR